MDGRTAIAAASEIPTDGTLLVTLRRTDDGSEAEVVVTKLDDGSVAAFGNYCMHWTDVRLDKGSGALVRNGEIVCQKHGATFQKESGYCDFGPCEGSVLETVDLAIEDGEVYLDDEDYEFSHVGPAEERDLSSGSRIDF
jgi:nitrite reductase/ring-hydroxylating ferredoxin subunit